MTADVSPVLNLEDFIARFPVSRETAERLEIYERLLRQWQKGTNLVSPATLDQVWHRHFADSAQLLEIAGDWTRWVDLGSGAGFPALVIAICVANREDGQVHIVESNARKSAFCREVVRETGCSVEIHHGRIESLQGDARLVGADIVSARALAPMNQLLNLAAPLFGAGTTGLFPKGRQVENELAQCDAGWSFERTLHPSLTDAGARIVAVTNLRRIETARKETGDE